jgi:hypothetical protein
MHTCANQEAAMSTTEVRSDDATNQPGAGKVGMKLEVVVIARLGYRSRDIRLRARSFTKEERPP